MNQGHFCYICVDLPEVARQEAAFFGALFVWRMPQLSQFPFSLHKILLVLKNVKFVSQQC